MTRFSKDTAEWTEIDLSKAFDKPSKIKNFATWLQDILLRDIYHRESSKFVWNWNFHTSFIQWSSGNIFWKNFWLHVGLREQWVNEKSIIWKKNHNLFVILSSFSIYHTSTVFFTFKMRSLFKKSNNISTGDVKCHKIIV